MNDETTGTSNVDAVTPASAAGDVAVVEAGPSGMSASPTLASVDESPK